MNPIFAIDPGPEKSAYVEYVPNWVKTPIASWGHVANEELLRVISLPMGAIGVIEDIHYYGPKMNAGADVFTTCKWIGKFDLAWHRHTSHDLKCLTKPQVSHHLCNKQNATKSELHYVLYQRFGDGSRRSAVGVKNEPGPLYGLKGDHVWDALALAVTWDQQNQATT